MIVIIVLCFFSVILGMVLVASNPSPYFAALGLVLVAGAGCGVLMIEGGSFLALILFLIYLGGMLVVFAYSAALAAEPYPEAWLSRTVFFNVCVYIILVLGAMYLLSGEPISCWVGHISGVMDTTRGDLGGVALMYSSGWLMLAISGWFLFVALLLVLHVSRKGTGRNALRVV